MNKEELIQELERLGYAKVDIPFSDIRNSFCYCVGEDWIQFHAIQLKLGYIWGLYYRISTETMFNRHSMEIDRDIHVGDLASIILLYGNME